jgi:hypothetical protein
LKNLLKIVEPVAKDNASQLNLTAINQENHFHVSINMNSNEGNAIQNRIKEALESLKEPEHHVHDRVVFYWWMAKGDVKSQSGDRGIVEAIHKKPLKVIYGSDGLKEKMININGNPFHLAYVVDVKVETIEGKPVAYKIVELHETFPKMSTGDEKAA